MKKDYINTQARKSDRIQVMIKNDGSKLNESIGELVDYDARFHRGRVRVTSRNGKTADYLLHRTQFVVLNEGIMDNVKQGIKTGIKKGKELIENTFTGFKKVMGYVIEVINGVIQSVMTPLNLAIKQMKGEMPNGVTFIASDAVIAQGRANGVSISNPKEIPSTDDESTIQAINNFWHNVIEEYKTSAEEEGINDIEEDEERINESVELLNKVYNKELKTRNKELFESGYINKKQFREGIALYEAMVSSNAWDSERFGSGRHDLDFAMNPNKGQTTSPIPNLYIDDVVKLLEDRIEKQLTIARQIEEEYANAADSNISLNYEDVYRKYAKEGAIKDTKDTIMIFGAPGIGKTEVVNQAVQKIRDNGLNFNIININASYISTEDFTLPFVKKSAEGVEVVDLVKSWLPVIDFTGDPEEDYEALIASGKTANNRNSNSEGFGGIIFIDEFTRMSRQVSNAFMNIIQSRIVGDKYLGPNWVIVCASNRPQDMGGDASDIVYEQAVVDRLFPVNFIPTFDAWVKWAKKKGIEETIINFLSSEVGNQYWYKFVDATNADQSNISINPTPRSWDRLDAAMKNFDIFNNPEKIVENLPKAKEIVKNAEKELKNLKNLREKLEKEGVDEREYKNITRKIRTASRMIQERHYEIQAMEEKIKDGVDVNSPKFKEVMKKFNHDKYKNAIQSAGSIIGSEGTEKFQEFIKVYQYLNKEDVKDILLESGDETYNKLVKMVNSGVFNNNDESTISQDSISEIRKIILGAFHELKNREKGKFYIPSNKSIMKLFNFFKIVCANNSADINNFIYGGNKNEKGFMSYFYGVNPYLKSGELISDKNGKGLIEQINKLVAIQKENGDNINDRTSFLATSDLNNSILGDESGEMGSWQDTGFMSEKFYNYLYSLEKDFEKKQEKDSIFYKLFLSKNPGLHSLEGEEVGSVMSNLDTDNYLTDLLIQFFYDNGNIDFFFNRNISLSDILKKEAEE